MADKKSSTPQKKGGRKSVQKENRKQAAARPDQPFHIVAIGASAGGLQALEQFFRNMEPRCGLGFVVISHLDPDHKSLLSELLAKYTEMEVAQVKDGMVVRPDHVYVIPPDTVMRIEKGVLHLMKPDEPRGQRHPIDLFFRTLAEDQGERAIGIILSGTGTEGTLGLKSIQGAGGLAIVQDPATAKFDGMPRNAIDSGQIDYILAPEDIPSRLATFAHDYDKAPLQVREKLSEDQLHRIHLLIRNRTGHDFTKYKPKTILRRIERRMVLHQLDDLEKYIRFLRQTPSEIDNLFQELLIRVTNFFRDPEAYQALQKKALPALFSTLPPGEDIRVWVAGCSTGEEAYSIAIILHEYLTENDLAHGIRVFATDIDHKAIAMARVGAYPASISADVPPARLKRYFTRRDNTYLVNKNIREMVIFAEQDLLRDPPFSKLDLVSCRNLLIYLGSELQKKAMTLFHYGLKPGGMIFLGASESLGFMGSSFEPVDNKWKIWRIRKKSGKPARLDFGPFSSTHGEKTVAGAAAPSSQPRKNDPIEDLATRRLLQIYAPPSVLVDDEGTILYFHGRTGRYLEPTPGKARLQIQSMVRKGLAKYLEQAMRTARITGKEVVAQRTVGGKQRRQRVVRPQGQEDQG